MKLRTKFGIVLARLTKRIMLLLGCGGTNFPGVVAKFVNKDILRDLSDGIITILITGTNGKSTSVRIIESILKDCEFKYFSNFEGANIETGIIASYIKNIHLSDKLEKSIAVIETDEAHLKVVAQAVNPAVILVTNLFDDQIERFGTPDELAIKIKKVLASSEATLCLNEDCSFYEYFTASLDNSIISYHTEGQNIIVDGEKLKILSELPGDWNISNIAGACAVAKAMGIDLEQHSEAINNTVLPFGRMEIVSTGDTYISINLAKNTNCVDGLLDYYSNIDDISTVVIGINNRTGDTKDPRWFGNSGKIGCLKKYKHILVCGDCRNTITDILNRSLPNPSTIETMDSLECVVDRVLQYGEPCIMLLNYTCMMDMRKRLKHRGFIVKEFWIQ